MKISVITVCYNCENAIKDTLLSVMKQKYTDFEYVLIDGASRDATIRIAEQYKDKIPNMRIISEPDHGIYDAMNKGAKIAKGEYVFFLNAGDIFVDETVLMQVGSSLNSGQDVYYGNVKKGEMIETYPAVLKKGYLIYREKMVCHQAIFARRRLLLKFPFDEQFKICADRDWLLKVLGAGASTQYMKDITVCCYAAGGVSEKYEDYNKDSLELARKYGGNFAVIFVKLKRLAGKAIGHRW